MTAASSDATPTTEELATLFTVAFDWADDVTILGQANAAVSRVGPCRTEATYRLVDGSCNGYLRVNTNGPISID